MPCRKLKGMSFVALSNTTIALSHSAVRCLVTCLLELLNFYWGDPLLNDAEKGRVKMSQFLKKKFSSEVTAWNIHLRTLLVFLLRISWRWLTEDVTVNIMTSIIPNASLTVQIRSYVWQGNFSITLQCLKCLKIYHKSTAKN